VAKKNVATSDSAVPLITDVLPVCKVPLIFVVPWALWLIIFYQMLFVYFDVLVLTVKAL
jgi:hypothetical protein